MLTISLEALAFIIVKAREYEAEVEPVDEASGSNAADDGETDILEDRPGNPTEAELRGALGALNVDEMNELLALMWVGRGDFTKDDWAAALGQARDLSGSKVDVLLGTPGLPDYLEDALSEMDLSIEDYEIGRL